MADQAPPPWLIVLLVSAIGTLGGVIVYMFKRYERREDRRDKAITEERAAMNAERTQWKIDREKMAAEHDAELETARAEYEAARAQLAQRFSDALRDEIKTARAHEDAVREEFATIIERIDAQATEASKALVEMLQKFYDRFVGPRSRSY